MSLERVQKIIARAGLASRRGAEELIQEGAVTINGKVAKLGDQAEFGKDSIKVNGKLIHATQTPFYAAFYKPKNTMCLLEEDENQRETIAKFLKKLRGKFFLLDKLDFKTEGLILLSNDGKWAQEVKTEPDLKRVYHVKIKGFLDEDQMKRIRKPLRLVSENGSVKVIKPKSVEQIQSFTQKVLLEVVFFGDGTPDVRTFLEKRGLLVDRVVRNSIGRINLQGLRPGQFKLLKTSLIQKMI